MKKMLNPYAYGAGGPFGFGATPGAFGGAGMPGAMGLSPYATAGWTPGFGGAAGLPAGGVSAPWMPTGGGGYAKQYPPGMVGIPYAFYPGMGLVQ